MRFEKRERERMSNDDKETERVQLDKDTQSMIKNLDGNKKCCVRGVMTL